MPSVRENRRCFSFEPFWATIARWECGWSGHLPSIVVQAHWLLVVKINSPFAEDIHRLCSAIHFFHIELPSVLRLRKPRSAVCPTLSHHSPSFSVILCISFLLGRSCLSVGAVPTSCSRLNARLNSASLMLVVIVA